MRIERRTLWILATLALIACGDDDGGDPTGPTVRLDQIAGLYDLTRLSFDPQGSLPEKDILQRLAAGERPQLNVLRTEVRFQLVFRDPVSGRVVAPEGTFALLPDSVRFNLPADTLVQRLLLPRPLTLAYDSVARTLDFDGETTVALALLRARVPEFAQEPLQDPVPGTLKVRFTLRP